MNIIKCLLHGRRPVRSVHVNLTPLVSRGALATLESLLVHSHLMPETLVRILLGTGRVRLVSVGAVTRMSLHAQILLDFVKLPLKLKASGKYKKKH